MLDNLPVVHWTTDPDLCFTSICGNGLRILDLQEDELVGQRLQDYFQTDDPEFQPILSHRRALKGESITFEQAWQDDIFEVFLAPLVDADGQVTGVRGLGLVVTAWRLSQQAQQRSEQQLKELFDSSPDAIFVEDYEGYVLDCNSAACQLHDLPAQTLIGSHVTELVPADIRDTVRRDFSKLVEGKWQEFESQSTTAAGRTIPVEVRVSRIHYGEQPALLLHVRDISKRKAVETKLEGAQQQVIQHERLRALGQMASGIAHEFNNALASILGYSELLLTQDENDNPEELREYLETINTVARDASHMVKRMSQFYRRGEEASHRDEAVNITELIEQVVSLTRPKWRDQARARGASITVTTHLQTCPLLTVNATEMRELFTNLIFNAADAIETRGRIALSAKVRKGNIELSISDDGRGMSDEVRRKCLEPFYTTKENKGTGLGLSIVYGIARRHGGTVEIHSREGSGTTITLRLPITVAGQKLSVDTVIMDRELKSHRILLVDDEQPVRQMYSKMLERSGHQVTTVATGEAALQQLAVDAPPFDVVITDRALPDMSGDQIAQEIKPRHPQLPFILLTGFGDMMKARGEHPEGIDTIVSKPTTAADLQAAIRSLSHPAEEPKLTRSSLAAQLANDTPS